MEIPGSLGDFFNVNITDMEVPDEIFSDEEIPHKKHTALLKKAAATYGKKYQRVLVSDRNEPTLEGSEFHLSNKIDKDEKLAKTLAGSLEKDGKHSYIAQKLKKVQRSSKPLPTPLERPDAEKIKRAVAYDNTKTSLNRWEPMVVTNKITSELNFPLNTPFFKMRSTRDFMANYKPESKLEKEVENILSGFNEEIGEKPPQTPEPKRTFYLNRKEILEQRKELARVRAQQSYREAKARRQNKIKSKKYHRILRREKTKKQLQEFEKLQKTDPEAALKKLDELEKTRAEERVSLRHRSTGQWAKNKAVHAKYDKESRQQLHQQLRMSRDLTVKVNAEQSSDDDDTEEDNPVSEDNPWIKGTNEYEEFTNKYRKYWNEHALNKCKSKENDRASESNEELNDSVAEGRDYSQKTHLVLADPVEVDITNSGFIVHDVDEERMKNMKNGISFNRSWKCTAIQPKKPKLDLCKNEEEIDSMFEVMEKAIIKENRRKVSNLKDRSRENPKIKNRMPPSRRDIKAPEQCQVKADTSLEAINDESIRDAKSKWNVTEVSLDLKETGKLTKVAAGSSKAKFDECEINPSNFIQINEKQIHSCQIPDLIVEDDDNTTKTEKEMMMTISEAFTDDDVVAEFRQEKEAIADKGKPKDIDLTLPGWGEWAGKGISASKRKKNRFVIKAPKNIPRKDDKKQSVIINENADSKARVHQVTELPHPYVAVESFESSIRAPLGSTWVPETAHRKLIAPKIKTLMGTVIEPLSEDALLDDSEEFNENDLD